MIIRFYVPKVERASRKKLDRRTHLEEPFTPKNLSWRTWVSLSPPKRDWSPSTEATFLRSPPQTRARWRGEWGGGASCLIAQCWHKPSREWAPNRFLDVFQEARGHFPGVTEESQSRAIEDELWTGEGGGEGEKDLSRDRSVHFHRRKPRKLCREEGYSIFLSSLSFSRENSFSFSVFDEGRIWLIIYENRGVDPLWLNEIG